MRLHLSTIGDSGLQFLDNQYVAPTRTKFVDKMMDMKNHNIMMIDITSSLSYSKVDEVKD